MPCKNPAGSTATTRTHQPFEAGAHAAGCAVGGFVLREETRAESNELLLGAPPPPAVPIVQKGSGLSRLHPKSTRNTHPNRSHSLAFLSSRSSAPGDKTLKLLYAAKIIAVTVTTRGIMVP